MPDISSIVNQLMNIKVEMVLLVFVGIILFFSILNGLIQGAKKNAFFLFGALLFWVLFFLIAPIITARSMWDTPQVFGFIKSSFGIPTTAETLTAYIATQLEPVLADAQITITSTSILFDFAAALIQSVLKIVFLIVFAIIYRIIECIVYKAAFKKYCVVSKKKLNKLEARQKKRADRKLQPDENLDKKVERIRKNRSQLHVVRPLGLFTGLIRGFIGCFIILSIINSLVFSFPVVNKNPGVAVADDDQTQQTEFTLYDLAIQKANNETVEIAVNKFLNYQSSLIGRSTGFKINGKAADKLFIDGIISGKSGNTTINLRQELENSLSIADLLCRITGGFDEFSPEVFARLTDAQVEQLVQIINIISNDGLLESLSPLMVEVVSQLEAVDSLAGDYIDWEELKTLDWSQELVTIVKIIRDVYAFGNDLTTLDYTNLDPTKVEKLFEDISELKSVQIALKFGSLFLVNQLLSEEENRDLRERLSNDLVNVLWNEDIQSYGSLYRRYLDLGISAEVKELIESKESKDTIKLFTSVETDKYKNLLGVFFETSLFENVLPDVMDLLKTKIPAEYSSLINPNIKTTSDWENELFTVIDILKDITLNGKDPIDPEVITLDRVKNISNETILRSDLLSYAVITMMVDASDGNGVLGDAASEYIFIPSTLKAKDPMTNRYDDKWYGENGELSIMLTQVKDLVAAIDDISKPESSIPEMLAAIDGDLIVQSDVLYYTLSNLLTTKAGDVLTIPLSSYTATEMKGDKEVKIIDRNEIKAILNAISDPNVVDINSMIRYYTEDEENGKHYGTKEELEGSDYKTEISFGSIDDVMGLIKSEKLYNLTDKDETNLNKLFASKILRATITDKLASATDGFVVIPTSENAVTSDHILNSEQVEVPFNVLTINECKNLIKTIDKLDLDLEAISNSPMDILDNFGHLDSDNKRVFDEELVSSIFTQGNDYSEILHATISKFLIDGIDFGGMSFIIPESEKSENYIKSSEIVHLFNDLYYMNIGEIMNNDDTNVMLGNIIENEYLNNMFTSASINATLTNYLVGDSFDITLPNDDAIFTVGVVTYSANSPYNNKIIAKSEILAVLNAIKALKTEVSTTTPGTTYSSLLTFDDVTIENINNTKDEILQSKIIHATVSKMIVDNETVKVGTNSQYESLAGVKIYDGTNYILESELKKLFNSFGLIATGKINNLSFDSNTIFNLSDENMNKLLDSEIVVNTLSYEIFKLFDNNSELYFLNYDANDAVHGIHGFTSRTITGAEIKSIFNGISVFRSGSENIDSISFDFEAIKSLSDSDIKKVCSSNLISYNAFKQVKAKNSAIGNTLVLDEEHKQWYYDGVSYANDDLYKLIVALKTLYTVDGFQTAFEGGLNDASLLNNFKSETFINTVTENDILCDSIPNILQKFSGAIDEQYTNYFVTPGQIYSPAKSTFATNNDWKNYWRGEEVIEAGQLYKLFNGIQQLNQALTYIGSNAYQALSCLNVAKESDILMNTIDFETFINNKFYS